MAYKKISIKSTTQEVKLELKFYVDPQNPAIVNYDARLYDGATKVQQSDGVNNDDIPDNMTLKGNGQDQKGRKLFVYSKGFFSDEAEGDGNNYRLEATILQDGNPEEPVVETCKSSEPIGAADILIHFE